MTNHEPNIDQITHDHRLVQKCYNQGQLHEGMTVARNYINKNGHEDSQLEILLLAKGLFATGNYYECKFWLQQTVADPIQKIELEEKVDRLLGVYCVN